MAFMKAKIACRHSAWESALESRIKAPFGKQIVAVDVLIFRDVWRDSFGGLECGVLNTGRNSKSSTTSRARMSWTSTLPGLKAEIKWISGFFAHMCGQQVQIRIVKDHRNCQITVLFDIPTPRFVPSMMSVSRPLSLSTPLRLRQRMLNSTIAGRQTA